MSLRHAVLGLLAEGPASGYDLAQRFQQVLGAVWPAKHPVRDWLSHGDVDHTVRLQPLLRSFFFWLMDPEDPRRHLTQETQYFAAAAEQYRAYAAAKDRGDFGDSAQTQSTRIAIEAGVRLYQALADWAAWAQTVPPLPEQPAVPAADA